MTYRPVRRPMEFYQELMKEVGNENPDQKNHLGKLLLKAMRRHPKYATSQIDAGTGKEESMGSLLDRCIATAQAFRNMGMNVGDVVTVLGRNHLDVTVPLYASLFCGIGFNGMDTLLNKNEMLKIFRISRPKLVICESINVPVVAEISQEIGFKIVVFTKLADNPYPSFSEFLEEYRIDENYDDFQVSDFNPNTTSALICCTSGSTGLPKLANLTHSNIIPAISMVPTSTGPATDLSLPGRLLVCVAPIYWFTSKLIHIQSALYCISKVQSSAQLSSSHIVYIVNKYRPSAIAMTPALANLLLKKPEIMDWSCFHVFLMAGAAVTEGLIDNINNLIGRPAAMNTYGLTEACGAVFYMGDKTPSSLGKPVPYLQTKVTDINTEEEVGENSPGELMIRGPTVCKGYYNDPENTKVAFTEDGWFRTGDLVYKNKDGYYFYFDRIRSMLNIIVDSVHYHISPGEIENEIKKLPGVADVSVTGVKQADDFDLPIAMVVRNNGHNITAEEIEECVRKNLSKPKHLTGGVMFVNSLPLMSAGKINRLKIRDVATEYHRQTSQNSQCSETPSTP